MTLGKGKTIIVSLERSDSTQPWGFRLVGGVDINQPLTVQKVAAGSIAERCGLTQDVEVVRIGDKKTLHLTHEEAQEAILSSGNVLNLFVTREDSEISGSHTSSSHEQHQTVKAVVHSQYNSPMKLYSAENIAENLSQQVQVLTDSFQTESYSGGYSPPSQRDNVRYTSEEEKYYSTAAQYPPAKSRQTPPPPPPKPKPPVQSQVRYPSSGRESPGPAPQKHTWPPEASQVRDNRIFAGNYRPGQRQVTEEYSRQEVASQQQIRQQALQKQSNLEEVYQQQQQFQRQAAVQRQSSQELYNARSPSPVGRFPPRKQPSLENLGPVEQQKVYHQQLHHSAQPRQQAQVNQQVPATHQLVERQISEESRLYLQQQQAIQEHQLLIEQRRQQELQIQRQQQLQQEQRRIQILQEEKLRQQQIQEQEQRRQKALQFQRQKQIEQQQQLERQRSQQEKQKMYEEEYQQQNQQGVYQESQQIQLKQQKKMQDEEEERRLRDEQFQAYLRKQYEQQQGRHEGEMDDHYKRQFEILPPHPPNFTKYPQHFMDAADQHVGQFRQTGVCEFPEQTSITKMRDEYKPQEEAMHDAMPVATTERPDHLLPSMAKKQQTYITHASQSQHRVGFSAPGSPTSGRKQSNWPPNRGDGRLPGSGFSPSVIHPDGEAPKQFVWPPPRSDLYNNGMDFDGADSSRPAVGAWNPETGNDPVMASYRTPGEIHRQNHKWPPEVYGRGGHRGNLFKQSSLPDSKSRRLLEFDEVMKARQSIGVPLAYRPPPGTQYYTVRYYET